MSVGVLGDGEVPSQEDAGSRYLGEGGYLHADGTSMTASSVNIKGAKAGTGSDSRSRDRQYLVWLAGNMDHTTHISLASSGEATSGCRVACAVRGTTIGGHR